MKETYRGWHTHTHIGIQKIHKNQFCKNSIEAELLERNTKTKSSRVCFVLAICCCTWGLPLSVIFRPSETWLEKINFSFVDGYQLEIASGLKINDWVQSPIGNGFPTGLKPLWTQFLSPQSGTDCFVALVSFVAIDFYKFSSSYFTNISELWGRIWQRQQIWDWCSQVYHSMYIV